MGWGTGNIGGGSGGGLNFKVVGNPQPANPKENTIWLNTDVDITWNSFQEEQPEEMAEGEVWISTGAASQVAFNALKKGTIMVYPLTAKQYVDGAWVDVTAKTYQNGAWVDWWNGELYVEGNQYKALTGGWSVDKGAIQDASIFVGYSSSVPKFTTESTHATAIDMTDFTNLNVHFLNYSCPDTSNGFLKIIIRNEAGTTISTTSIKGGDTTASNFYGTVNVSAINVKAFVVIQVGHSSGSNKAVYATFDKVVLSK